MAFAGTIYIWVLGWALLQLLFGLLILAWAAWAVGRFTKHEKLAYVSFRVGWWSAFLIFRSAQFLRGIMSLGFLLQGRWKDSGVALLLWIATHYATAVTFPRSARL
jgi:hypothetical protein